MHCQLKQKKETMDISNIKYLNKTLHDSNNLLMPSTMAFEDFPLLEKFAQQTNAQVNYWHYYKKALALAHATKGQVTMKMLLIYADGNEHSWQEVSTKLFPNNPGKDIDCWRSLEERELITFSSKGKYGRKFYRITYFGREVLRVLDVNNVYFRVVRWFKLDEDKIIPAMMKADLNGEESWKDTLPESIIALLEALFNPTSKMHKLGSCYRWMNNVVWLVKHSQEFFEKIVHPDVTDWLDSHMHYYGVEKFYKILDKIAER